MINGGDDAILGTFDMFNGTISTSYFQDVPPPDFQNLSLASPNPITSAPLIPEWFEPYLGNDTHSNTDEGYQHHESNIMLNPATLDIPNSTMMLPYCLPIYVT